MTTKEQIESYVRRAKDDLRQEEDMGADYRVASILVTSSLQASLAPTEHLQRVTLTVGILSAVRSGLRFLNQNKLEWAGQPDVLPLMDEVSSEVATHALALLNDGPMPTVAQGFKGFYKNRFGLPSLRTDLRLAAPIDSETVLPFGPRFPKFEMKDIDFAVVGKINEDVAEMSSFSIPHLAEATSEEEHHETALTNLSLFCITYTALGKCVLCNWRTKQQAFLSMLACMEADYHIDREDEQNRKQNRTN
jgi:hypothetical protein